MNALPRLTDAERDSQDDYSVIPAAMDDQQIARRDSAFDVHPAANLFPLMSDEEFAALKQNIAERGQVEPIWLCDGKILDGRNRQRACMELGIRVATREYTGDSPVAFVWSLNGTRRQLSKSQLAVIAVKMLGPLKEEAQKRQLSGKGADGSGGRGHEKNLAPDSVQGFRESGRAVDQAAKLVGVGKTQVQEAKAVVEQAPDLVPEIEAGKMSVDKARKIMKDTYKPAPDAPRQPRERRVADISRLAAEGHRSHQIADELGITAERVREIAREESITLPDAQVGRTRAIDVRRVVEETVNGLAGYAMGLEMVTDQIRTIDPADAKEWAASINESLKPIYALRKQLLEVAK